MTSPLLACTHPALAALQHAVAALQLGHLQELHGCADAREQLEGRSHHQGHHRWTACWLPGRALAPEQYCPCFVHAPNLQGTGSILGMA